jgi:hypothetical protein
MNFTQDDIAGIVGSLYLENLALRRELTKVQADLAAARPDSKVQPLKDVTALATHTAS